MITEETVNFCVDLVSGRIKTLRDKIGFVKAGVIHHATIFEMEEEVDRAVKALNQLAQYSSESTLPPSNDSFILIGKGNVGVELYSTEMKLLTRLNSDQLVGLKDGYDYNNAFTLMRGKIIPIKVTKKVVKL